MQWRRGSVFVLITGTNALISSALFVPEEDVVDGGNVGCGDVSVAGDVGILLIVVAAAEEDVVEGGDVVGCNYSIAINVAMQCWLGLDDSQESAFGVVTTVYKFEVTGLWPSEVAKDDACGHILWLVGHRPDARFCIHDTTVCTLQVSYVGRLGG